MKKIFMFVLCFSILVGCEKKDNVLIETKYTEMENKLIEYGKLVYENDQWLNTDSEIVTTYMSLKELKENNGYDVSMFINPETGELCDVDETKIEFTIKDVSDKENIVYEFNPILVCEEKDMNLEVEKNYDLHNVLIDYMADIYDTEEWMNGGIEPSTYKQTLREFQQKGYDISMFVNSETKESCDLDETYGVFEILGITDEGRTDYVFGCILSCE